MKYIIYCTTPCQNIFQIILLIFHCLIFTSVYKCYLGFSWLMLRISYGKIPMKLKDIEIRTAQLFVTIVEYICVETFACFCIYDSKYIAYRLAQYPHGPGHLLFCVEILEITLSSYISRKWYLKMIFNLNLHFKIHWI